MPRGPALLPDGLAQRTAFRAVIFDLDGTLVQTEKLKAQAYALAVQRLLGLPRPPRAPIHAYREVVGSARDIAARHVMERLDLAPLLRPLVSQLAVEQPWEVLATLQAGIYTHMIANGSLLRANRWPHTIDFLRMVRQCGCKTALATMSSRVQATAVLQALGLDGDLDLVVTRDEVVHPKPHPDVYRAVCDSLEIIAEECLAIEDSPDGVRAALSAGIETLAFATPMTRNALAAARLLPRWCIVRAPRDLLRTVQWCLARRVRPSADPGVARSMTSHK